MVGWSEAKDASTHSDGRASLFNGLLVITAHAHTQLQVLETKLLLEMSLALCKHGKLWVHPVTVTGRIASYGHQPFELDQLTFFKDGTDQLVELVAWLATALLFFTGRVDLDVDTDFWEVCLFPCVVEFLGLLDGVDGFDNVQVGNVLCEILAFVSLQSTDEVPLDVLG